MVRMQRSLNRLFTTPMCPSAYLRHEAFTHLQQIVGQVKANHCYVSLLNSAAHGILWMESPVSNVTFGGANVLI